MQDYQWRSKFFCVACAAGKLNARRYSKKIQYTNNLALEAVKPFEKLAVDTVGPFKRSFTGNKYLLTMTDVFSKMMFVQAVKSKQDIPKQ